MTDLGQTAAGKENDRDSDHQTDSTNNGTESGHDNNIIYLPMIERQHFLDDAEFCDIYNYLETGNLTGDDNKDRLILLLAETFVLEEDQLLYRVTFPRNKKLQQTGMYDKRLCLPSVFRTHCLLMFHDN